MLVAHLVSSAGNSWGFYNNEIAEIMIAEHHFYPILPNALKMASDDRYFSDFVVAKAPRVACGGGYSPS